MNQSGQRRTKLLGVLGLKAASERLEQDEGGRRSTETSGSDPVKAMQDRMLHFALHNQRAYQSSQVVPMATAMNRSNRPYNKIKPPRGTLSDEKLPYLDWRLSLLLMQQVQSDERERLEVVQHEVVCQQQPSGPTSTLESHSNSSNDQHSEGREALMEAPKRSDQWCMPMQADGDNCQEDLLAKTALHRALLTNDALAAVPLLERESRYQCAGMVDDEDEEELNDNFSEASLGGMDANVLDGSAKSPPLLPASLFHRASFGLRSSAMERSDSTPKSVSSNKLYRLFKRGNGYHRDQSKGRATSLPKASDRAALGEVTVNNLFYDNSPVAQKKKWSLLAPHNIPLSGSQIAHESGVML